MIERPAHRPPLVRPPRQALTYDRDGRGEPLVLLHPLGADRHVWDPVLALLRPHRDVLRVDLPGFGGSPPLNGHAPPTPRRLAEALIGLLAELGLDHGRAHLAGNSLGGWVALEVAAAGHAATVTAIAPAGLWPRPLAPKPQLARRLARLLSPALGPALRSAAVRRVVLAGTVARADRVPPQAAAALVRAYARAPGFAAVNRAMRSGVFGSLEAIEVPVTLVWPERDRLVSRPATVPSGVRELRLLGAGHIPMWDAPQAVARALLAGSGATARAARGGL